MADLAAPRPFYRSWFFWLGLPGLLFLLWLWWIFPSRVFSFETRGRAYEIRAFRSVVEFTWSEFPWAKFGDTDVISILEEEDRLESGDHLLKRDSKAWPEGGRIDYVSMRAWLPSAVYGVLWLALLAWWQRRKNRLLKVSTPPPP